MTHVFRVVVQGFKVLVVTFRVVVQGFKIWGCCAIVEGFSLTV